MHIMEVMHQWLPAAPPLSMALWPVSRGQPTIAADMSRITLRTFSVDVTPPVGDFTCGGLHGLRATGVEQKLSLRGFILEQDGRRYAVASVEFCYLCGRSYDRFVAAIAEAADTPLSHASLHAVHTHDAPLVYEEVHALIDEPNGLHNEAWFSKVMTDTQAAIRAAEPCEVAAFSTASYPVYQFASSRRVILDDGECHIRFSTCGDPAVRAAPEGLIDPMLDQVVLYDRAEKPRLCMNFYACHPQVSDGRALWSGDTVGVALDLFDQKHPDMLTMHFDGCGGDITAGKYSRVGEKPRNRVVFGVRLYDAMQGAFGLAQPRELSQLSWHDSTVDIPLSNETEPLAHLRATVDDTKRTLGERYLAALKVHKLTRGEATYPFRTSRLALDDHHLLLLPAELVVAYQLGAKALRPGKVSVAAYGDCFLNYVGTAAMFDEGGYEVQPRWTEVGPRAEPIIREAIADALGGAERT